MSINPHLQSLLCDILFHIMGFSPSPEIHEPSLSNTKVKGHFYKQNNNIDREQKNEEAQESHWHVRLDKLVILTSNGNFPAAIVPI